MTSALAYQREYALNAICPYYTMFPLEFPLRILNKHRRAAPVVLDPFCGRGTTLYAARKHGLASYGLDISPVAAAIAQAKLASATAESVLALAARFISASPASVPETPFFQTAFSPLTLQQLCSLRDALLRAPPSDEATLLRAAVLGCLHGPRTKSVTTAGYFSNQMPRTFASKPDYSVRYWRNLQLAPPDVSVLDVLRRKLGRIADLASPSGGNIGNVRLSDARRAASYEDFGAPTLIITSPPYYGMRTYVQDQWLRHWFLGGPEEIRYENGEQLSHTGHDAFVQDLAKVWRNVRQISQPDARDMDIDSEDQSSERAELHFLAALADELMKALLVNGVMDRRQLQAVEEAVSLRVGTEPRTW